MENYLMLNGKRIDLTAEQIETLVGKKEKDPFERAETGKRYYFVDYDGCVEFTNDYFASADNDRYDAGNYCTDEEIMEQIALHETLNRRLRRYSMQHGGRDSKEALKWGIACDGKIEPYFWPVCQHNYLTVGTVRFINEEAANAAIEEIVKPFMEQHPKFRW